MNLSRQQLSEALFQMNDRYNQLVKSDENQDEKVMQQLLQGIVGENERDELLKAQDDETVRDEEFD